MAELRAVNTSPLIYLSRAGLLELLHAGADEVIVPQAVADEIGAWPTADAAQVALRTTPWLRIVPPETVPEAIVAWDLGSGETALLAYGLAHPGVTLVVDDRAARRCAAVMGISVRGTLGLVLTAKKRGLLPSARETLARLHEAGMYLADDVRDAALREVGE